MGQKKDALEKATKKGRKKDKRRKSCDGKREQKEKKGKKGKRRCERRKKERGTKRARGPTHSKGASVPAARSTARWNIPSAAREKPCAKSFSKSKRCARFDAKTPRRRYLAPTWHPLGLRPRQSRHRFIAPPHHHAMRMLGLTGNDSASESSSAVRTRVSNSC